MAFESGIEAAARVLREAEALLITAGAGMGVDSGLPDYRGKDGFWKAYPPAARLGLSYYQLANPEWFDRDPRLAWGFYGHRLDLYRTTVPHRGFHLLRSFGEGLEGGYFVFTSNVDGQFQIAGFDDERIEECHGSVHFLQCTRPCGEAIWDAHAVALTLDLQTLKAAEPLPVCPSCGRVARPNVLMFGDWLWLEHRTEIQRARFEGWLKSLGGRTRRRLVVVEIGAGEVIRTVRMTSEVIARRHDATLIRINPRDHSVPDARHISVPMGGLAGLLQIFSAL